MVKPYDLKGSKFKGLRGIKEDVVHRLLLELSEKRITISEMSSECNSIKQLQKVQSALIKGTGCSSWEEATEKFPSFTTAEQLEPFRKLAFSGGKLPEPFLRFCHRVTQ